MVELGQDLLLRRRRGLSADGRGDPDHAVDSLDEGAQRRLHRLARRERQPDPDLRPGHDQARRLASSRSRATSSRRTGSPTSPRDTCSTCRRPPTTTRSTTTSCRARSPTRSSGDSNYFFGRFDTYIGQKDHISVSLWHQRAAVKYYSELPHELATETTSDPQNSFVRPPQLGPHLRVEPAQPPDLRLPEPQRGLRLRQHGRGRQAAQDPGRRLEPRPVADELQRRLHQLRLQRQPRGRQHHHPPDVRPQRPRHLDQGQPHDQDRWRVPQHRREHPQPDERAGHVQLRPRGHRHPGRHQRQPDRELPPRGGGQRQPGRAHGVERLPAAERLDLPRRRHLERHQQADPELRPALGLLLAFQREVRPSRVLRPQRGQPVGRRPPRQSRLRGRRLGRGELRRAVPREELVRRLRPAPRRSPTRSTTRPSSAPDGASSTTARSTPGGAPAWPRTASTAT